MQVLLDYCHYIGVRIMVSVDSVGVEILGVWMFVYVLWSIILECMGLLFGFAPLPALIFICLTSHMNRLNVVRLSKVLRGIVCKELGVVLVVYASSTYIAWASFRRGTGCRVYFINPYLAVGVIVIRWRYCVRSIGHPLLYGGGIELGSGGV